MSEPKLCSGCGAILEANVCVKCGRDSAQTTQLTPDDDGVLSYFDVDGKFVPMLLAEDIMSESHFVTMRDSREVYVYDDGFYQAWGEVFIKIKCRSKLQDEYRRSRFEEVLDYIRASTFIKRREEPPHLISLKNGVLNIKTMELEPNNTEYLFFNKIPVDYVPEADCPKIKKFFMEIAGSEEDVSVMEEAIGYCLYRDYFIAKAIMLAGGGANGKSTWLNLVKMFLGGSDNVSGRSLRDLEEHRFAKADLHTKLANIYADLPDEALYHTGTFKMLTGRDFIAAERKHQHPFHFVNYAKLLFSTNKVPEAYDDTDAFFRRWIILNFPNVFIGDNDDPHIIDKLTTDEELSGLLNLALRGLKQLLERGHFSYTKTTDEIREDYVRKSSPITAFVIDYIEMDSEAFIAKRPLYAAFAAYCRAKAIPCVTQDTFFKNLPSKVAVSDFRPQIGKDRPSAFRGVRYNPHASTLSGLSRVFYTMVSARDQYGDGYVVEDMEDSTYIIVRIALDRVDSPDIKPKLPTERDSLVSALLKDVRGNDEVGELYPRDWLEIHEVPRTEAEEIIVGLRDAGKLTRTEGGWKV
jgi:putative DNA primase/helicase